MNAIHSLIIENLDENILDAPKEYGIIGYKILGDNLHKIYFKNRARLIRFLDVDYHNPEEEIDNSGICAIDGGFVIDFSPY
jgi:hypothetical protein